MSEELRLISESDTEIIQQRFQNALTPFGYHCTVEIGPAYDTDHNQVVVVTDIRNEDISKVIRKALLPIKVQLEHELGEAMWEWDALCKCGEPSRAVVFEWESDDAEDACDPCVCRECNRKRYREESRHKCRRCGKEYNPYKSESWKTRLEAYVAKEREEQPPEAENVSWEQSNRNEEQWTRKNAEIYEIGFNIHLTPMDEWELCCRDCAKAVYREWLQRVLNHPFTKECLE